MGHYVNESHLSLAKRITCKIENKLFSKKDNQVKGFADKSPRIDFVYFKVWKMERFHCYMEAKRLKEKDSGLNRAYINDGMDSYISEKYPIGCMLGYLLEDKTNQTIKGINSLLEKEKRNTETLIYKSNKLIKAYYESSHSDMGILKHLIFDFTNTSNWQCDRFAHLTHSH